MSNINPQSIDGTYPIAGQDNNSQGFRDNFTNTVNNFTFAAAELTDLQNNAVLKAALGSAGQTGTPTNDLNYAYLTHAQMIGAVETKNAIGNVNSGSFTVDWGTGHFQTVELVGTSATLAFASTWPATNLYTKLRLQVNTYANVCALTLPSAVSTNISSIQGASGQVVTLPAGSVYQFEFSTWNNGSTIAIQDVLRNYDITSNGASATFTTLNVTGNTTLAGGIVTSGLQQYSPTANIALTANVGVSRVLITPTPSGGITSFFVDVTLPNVTTDGTLLSISSNVAVNVLRTLSPWVGTTVSPNANVSLTAGSKAEYLYRSAESKWYKVG